MDQLRTTRLVLLALASLVAATIGCAADIDEDEGTVNIDEIPVSRRATIELKKGFVDGRPLFFYDFGEFVPTSSSWFPAFDEFPGMPVGELLVFADASGKATLGGAQHPIIDLLPKQARYSDFLQIVLVKAPAGYGENEIKSRGTLLRRGFERQETGLVVNCPVVGPDAKLGDTGADAALKAKIAGSYKRITVWHRKKLTACMLLDGGKALFAQGTEMGRVSSVAVEGGTALSVNAAELFAFKAAAYTGPDSVTGIRVPQNDVFRYSPKSPNYSPLNKIWDVTVPSDYVAGQITSYAALHPVPDFDDPRIEERAPAAFCNCPVVWAGAK